MTAVDTDLKASLRYSRAYVAVHEKAFTNPYVGGFLASNFVAMSNGNSGLPWGFVEGNAASST